jgi:uncharacterized membrane protein YdjX (TVP38/TMEM64 family)
MSLNDRNHDALPFPSSTDDRASRENLADLTENRNSGSLFSFKKDVIFISIFIVILIALQLTYFKQYAVMVPELCRGISEYGILAPLVFTIGVTILVCAGVPRLLLCPVGGMAFGVFWGVVYCVAGTIIAYYLIFLFVRWRGGNLINRYFPKLRRFNKMLDAGGVPAVILARQLPIHGAFVNLLLGVSSVRQRDFLIGTSIGLLPEAIPFTLVGKGMKQGSLEEGTLYVVLAVVVLTVFWLGMKVWTARNEVRAKSESGLG